MGALLFMKKSQLEFSPDSKVIKAADYLAFVEADKALDCAQDEAARIIAEARDVYEHEKKKGYAKGIEEGKGAMAERMLDTVHKTVDYFASVEETLCSLVMTAMKKILGEMDDKDLVLKVVRNALALVRNQKQVVLRVSPMDQETVQSKINDIMADFPGVGFIDIVPDGRLKKDGCILESDIGIIDASLDVQMEAIRRSLMKSIKRS